MTRKLILAYLLILVAAVSAWAQYGTEVAPQREVVIYEGDAAGGSIPLLLSGWGSGRAEEVSAHSYIGPRVLRIMTQGYYAGARLDFRRAISLTDYIGKPNAYIRMALKPALAPPAKRGTLTQPGQPGYVRPGGSRGSRGDRRDEDEYEPTYGPTVGPTPAETSTPSEPEFRAETLRLVLATDQGPYEIRDVSIEKDNKDERGWIKLAAPLALFKGASGQNAQRLVIFADRPDMFYVGEVRLSLVPVTPISLQVKVDPVETQPGKQVKFTATASAGLAPLEIVWDFDSADGLQEDAKGKEVVNIYQKVGEYTATCLVKDLTGGNQPFKRTMGVRIVAR